jgi:multidrug efflux pump subunit AcrB
VLNVKDVLSRIPGAGQVIVWGAGDYAMRIWLDPDKVAARNLTPPTSRARSATRTPTSPPA